MERGTEGWDWKGREGAEEWDRGGSRARLGYLSMGLRIPSYTIVYDVDWAYYDCNAVDELRLITRLSSATVRYYVR